MNKKNNKTISSRLKKIFLFLIIIFPLIFSFNFAIVKAEICLDRGACTTQTSCNALYSNPVFISTTDCPFQNSDIGLWGCCFSSAECYAVGGICTPNCTGIPHTDIDCPGSGNSICCTETGNTTGGAPDTTTPTQQPAQTDTQTQANINVSGANLFAGVSASCVPNQDQPGECTTADFVIVAMNVANFLLGIIAALALLFFIVAGIKMVISQGNSEQISSAKSMMLNSVIGIVIALCSFLIVRFVQDAIGLKDKVYNESIKIEGTINPK